MQQHQTPQKAELVDTVRDEDLVEHSPVAVADVVCDEDLPAPPRAIGPAEFEVEANPDPNVGPNGLFAGGVYVLRNDDTRRTYVGCTNSYARRIRQHRGEIAGGAKSTKVSTTWRYHVQVTGFASRSKALSFEWYVKHKRFPRARFEGCHWPPTRRRRRQIELLMEEYGDDKFPGLTVHRLDENDEEGARAPATGRRPWRPKRRRQRREKI